MASIEIIANAWPVRDVLPLLLTDRSAKKNIIFATDSYADRGEGYGAKNQITEQVLSYAGRCIIQPRVLKDAEEQLLRTRKKAEVFTPAWVCCLMNNHADEEWFGRSDVFGQLKDQEWTPTEGPIEMPKRKRWQAYVDSRRLEITCGEAPYLVSRYDMATGEIIPIKDRIGILDRKLRIVNENAATEEEWLKWTLRAFQAVYGYEYQGDNLLVARVNLLLTYTDYLQERWDRKPTKKELEEVAKVISWNLWQMDGLKGSIPLGALYEQYHQLTIFDIFGMDESTGEDEPEEYIPCRVFDWRGQNKSIEFNAFRERRNGSMKFDFIIGNPPYQDETVGEQKQFAPPIYDKFMDETYKIGTAVELIHPARFLFNAGGTAKEWNQKMLNDEHFKVLYHEQDSSKLFSNTDIKGGVAVTYHDSTKVFGAIGTFTAYTELNSILNKVRAYAGFTSLNQVIANRGLYRFSKKVYVEHPEEMAKITDSRIGASAFDRISALFPEEKPNDGHEYVRFYGLLKAKRVYRWFRRDYFNPVSSFEKYRVFIPAANGSGALGEVLSTPIIGEPMLGHTETFMSIGAFDTRAEAQACYKYICSKFCRVMLGVLKITQHNSPEKWGYVPMQDFTATSDIDWTQSVAGIDRQLYAKYGLSDEEITFIETHVKEME